MNPCSPTDLKDYILDELPAPERARLDQHLAGCAACRQELRSLALARAALVAVPDEEPPRRIAFVSDKIFEPRWYQRLWRSGPQLGFVSAAMLAAAILAHGIIQPQPSPVPVAQLRPAAAGFEDVIAQRVAAAIAESEARQTARFEKVLAAKEKQFEFQRRANLIAMQEYTSYLQKVSNVTQRASLRSEELQ